MPIFIAMEAALEDIKNLILEISKSLEEIIGIFDNMFSLADKLDTMGTGFKNMETYQNRTFGKRLIPILERFQDIYFRLIAPHLKELEKYKLVIRGIKEKDKNWFLFLHTVPPRELLGLLKQIEESYRRLKAELEQEILLYKKIKRFPIKFENMYKDYFESFLDVEEKLLHSISNAEYLTERYYKDERAIIGQIQRMLSKRERIKINLSQLDPMLKGTITLNIIFDISGRSVEFVEYDKYTEDWDNFFIDFSAYHGLSFDDVFLNSKRLFEAWVTYFIKENGRFIREIFLQDKISINLSVYVMDKLRGRGFVGKVIKRIFSPSGMEKTLIISSDQRDWKIYLNVKKVSHYLYSYLENEPFYLQDLSDFIVHELSHVADKNLYNSNNILDGFRKEGITVFSEYIANTRNSNRFSAYIKEIEKYFSRPISEIIGVIKINKESENEIYSLGFYFCIVMFSSDLMRKFGVRLNPPDINALSKLLENEEYYSYGLLYIRFLRQMKTKFFLNKYVKETKELNLPSVFTDDLVRIINEVL